MNLPVRQTDACHGKQIGDVLFKLFKENQFEETTVVLAKEGFDNRGFVTSMVLGLFVKLPIVIETVESEEKVLPLAGRHQGDCRSTRTQNNQRGRGRTTECGNL